MDSSASGSSSNTSPAKVRFRELPLVSSTPIEAFFPLKPGGILPRKEDVASGDRYLMDSYRSEGFLYPDLIHRSKVWLSLKVKDYANAKGVEADMDGALAYHGHKLGGFKASLDKAEFYDFFRLFQAFYYISPNNPNFTTVPLGSLYKSSLTEYDKLDANGRLCKRSYPIAHIMVLPTFDFCDDLLTGFAAKFFYNGTALWDEVKDFDKNMNFATYQLANARNATYLNYVMTYALGLQHDFFCKFEDPESIVPGNGCTKFDDYTCMLYAIGCRLAFLFSCHDGLGKLSQFMNSFFLTKGGYSRLSPREFISFVKTNVCMLINWLVVEHVLPDASFRCWATGLKSLSSSKTKNALKNQ